MDRKNIDLIAKSQDDRILLAKLWDKIQAGIKRNICAHTGFLSPREIQLSRYLFGELPGLTYFGGYDDAERKMLIFLPEYLDAGFLTAEGSPVVCLRADFFKSESLTHRDFLGALMGAGITRESIGDILVSDSSCDFLVTEEIAPFLLQNLDKAGRVSLKLSQIHFGNMHIPEKQFSEIHDTVASMRLDSIVSSGFRISRNHASELICAEKVFLDGIVSAKPDKLVSQGDKISVRGMGKIRLSHIGQITKKGRISVVILRYE